MKAEAIRFLATGLLLLLSACGSPQEKAQKAVQRFEAYYAQHDMFRARVEIRTAIHEQDDVPDYWNKLGRVELALQNYFNAYSAYSRALELDKNNVEALQSVAELSYSGGTPDDALKYADQMLAKEPSNLRMMFIKGSVAFDRGKLDEAHGIADRMITIDPGNEGAAILLARVSFSQGDPKAAIDRLETSVVRDGASTPKLLTLLDFYSRQDDFGGIEGVYRRMFRLEPRSIDLRLDYAKTLYDYDRSDRALAMIDALLRANPNNMALQRRVVNLWVSVGSKAIAIDQVRRFAAAGNDQMKVALAQLAINQHRFADAAAMLKPYVDKDEITPENVLANTLYASAVSGLGRKDEALLRATRVLAFDKTNPKALLLRVQIMVDRHNLDQALTDAQVVGRDNPDLAAARIALAQVYTLRKERVLADGVFARAADDLPQDLDLLNAYIAYLIDTGRRTEAVGIASDFTRHNPEMLDGWKVRADLCLTVGNDDCLHQVLDAFGRLRGGTKAKLALEQAMADRQKAGARVSDTVSAIVPRVLAGQVGLETIAHTLIAQGRVADAEKLAGAVIARRPTDDAARLTLANIALLRGDRGGAEAGMQAVIGRSPREPQAYRDLARLRFGASDRNGAFAALHKGLAALPGDRTLLGELATMQQAAGDAAGAATSYRQLMRLDPANLVALNNLICILAESRNPGALREAQSLARRIEAVDQPAFLDTRGWLALRTGDVAGANVLLKKTVDSGSPAPIFRYHYAEALIAGGDAAGARGQAQAALAGASGNEPWVPRARALLQVRT